MRFPFYVLQFSFINAAFNLRDVTTSILTHLFVSSTFHQSCITFSPIRCCFFPSVQRKFLFRLSEISLLVASSTSLFTIRALHTPYLIPFLQFVSAYCCNIDPHSPHIISLRCEVRLCACSASL
ncbi:hypothetical protein CRM22_007396 [Opisthorchis felineus]|uniref:Uncharacterized protein n=1 Tax=Opisthorchis felineus TaxID=147828 RepID=A0A4V3SDZ3_OPIFE|nr:hypothetical protein CRM22_007396 [Opisthorchis felineus]